MVLWRMVALAFVALCRVGCRGSPQETALIKDILSKYETASRPVRNYSDAVNVTLDVAINQLFGLDEKHQVLKTGVWIRLTWTDALFTWNPSEYGDLELLTIPSTKIWVPDLVLWNKWEFSDAIWNKSDYGGLEDISIPSTDIWTPDLTLYNTAGEKFTIGSEMFVKLTYDGKVTWNTPVMLESSCRVNVKYFPFDKQSCDLKFGSWSYTGWQVDMYSKNDTGDTDNFISNGEWLVEEMPAVRNVTKYACCPEPFPTVTYTIVIQRRPLYYTFNLVFPVIFITMITMLAFYLPPESGEKVALGVTVLLAMMVFLLIIAESMPPTSEVVPLIGIFFATTIVLLGLSTAMSVIVLHVYFKGSCGKPVPDCVRRIVLGNLACIFGMQFEIKRFEERRKSLRGSRTHDGEIGKHNSGIRRTFLDRQTDSGDESIQNKGIGLNPVVHVDMSENASILYEIYKRVNKMGDEISQKFQDDSQQDAINMEWQMVARVIDRLFLIAFIFITVIVSLAILLERPDETE